MAADNEMASVDDHEGTVKNTLFISAGEALDTYLLLGISRFTSEVIDIDVRCMQ